MRSRSVYSPDASASRTLPRRAADALAFVLLLLAPFHSARAGDTPSLLELLAGMASTSGVVTEFRETKELALLALPLESRGLLYFAPPDRLARFTTAPAYSALIIDGEVLRFREGESGTTVDLTGNPMARVFVDNFIVLFNGDADGLRERYEVEILSEPSGRPSGSSDSSGWKLVLSPRRSPLAGVIESVTLHGDGRGIKKMVLNSLDGDTTTTFLDAIDRDRPFTPTELERLFGEGRSLERDRVGAPAAP
jgi:hypothetical protein